MNAFTPGPWKCTYGNSAREFLEISIRPIKSPIEGLVLPIASVRYPGHDFGQANAHLIVASPDMYEALKKIDGLHPKASSTTEWNAAFMQVSAAIAKAEGKA